MIRSGCGPLGAERCFLQAEPGGVSCARQALGRAGPCLDRACQTSRAGHLCRPRSNRRWCGLVPAAERWRLRGQYRGSPLLSTCEGNLGSSRGDWIHKASPWRRSGSRIRRLVRSCLSRHSHVLRKADPSWGIPDELPQGRQQGAPFSDQLRRAQGRCK